MEIAIDFIIDERTCNEASFEYYLAENRNIKSITFKSILFYNSWWLESFFEEDKLAWFIDDEGIKTYFGFGKEGHFNLNNMCDEINLKLKPAVNYVKLYSAENNYIIIELTEDRMFKLDSMYQGDGYLSLNNKWFGFKQETFTKKGKYYSSKPLNFYRTDLFLRCNLVNQQTTLYNNENSNIFCIIPVDDGEQIKAQRYEPNCTRIIQRCTNYLKFEITDEKGRVVNFRGTHVIMNINLNLY